MVPAYAAQMFNIGMADEVQRQRIQKYTDAIVSYIKQGNRLAAFTQWDEMLNGTSTESSAWSRACLGRLV